MVVCIPDSTNNGAQDIAKSTGPSASVDHAPRLSAEPSRRGDRQLVANRLDPVRLSMSVDEADHHFARRWSSAWSIPNLTVLDHPSAK
jgi:hypothetical protein